MNNLNELFNLSIKERRNELNKSRLESLKKATNPDNHELSKKMNDEEIQKIQDEKNNNSIQNQSAMDKYKKEIVGNQNKEPIIPKSNPDSQKQAKTNYSDNSIVLNHVYNEKTKNNTHEVSSKLNNKFNNS